ncbi:MAG: DmsE family decaheme c-type cytochrome [Acidobacteria bacterium]|nr:DmsE family decaheme c-type cytochrome [Acidobacteriota bacterium]
MCGCPLPIRGGLFLSLLLAGAWPLRGEDPQAIGTTVAVTPETCRRCHRDHYDAWARSTHARIDGRLYKSPGKQGCEACHGSGEDHVQSGNRALIFRFTGNSPEAVENACLKCHQRGNRLYWRGSPHESRNITCTNCHTLHKQPYPVLHASRFLEKPLETRLLAKQTSMEVCFQCHLMQKAQLQRSSHMPLREGKLTCVDCHNPHGTATPKLLRENSINENCYRCHAEKRGPFLWEHPPVAENCLNCHQAHGSIHEKLLKLRTPRLCQQCHVRGGHPTLPQVASNRLIYNLGCANCHSQIHGSNHPSGVRFHR